ncbi:hypothetical protein J2809_000943 [Arthrobacter pascens]|uniref:hypothetical protein n=1 Tax=Arthrobacter pascens TaxID=1677 RepID=UPI002860107D|nr:hypothetical protein [Arthrobacter pascens]MDR6556601.1 hypothetical protein [Arthrobacter pascens]
MAPTVARRHAVNEPHLGAPMGGVAQYEDIYRCCYVRGPDGTATGSLESVNGL